MAMDGHLRIPNLPTANYQGYFQVATLTSTDKGPYEYQLNLRITHSIPFQLSMLLWTWGLLFFLILATGALLVGVRNRRTSDGNIVTAASALVVFVPVYELALQSFKAPLGMTLSDVIVFSLLALDVMILVLAIRRNRHRNHRSHRSHRRHPPGGSVTF